VRDSEGEIPVLMNRAKMKRMGTNCQQERKQTKKQTKKQTRKGFEG
jgi:hypothetical protein